MVLVREKFKINQIPEKISSKIEKKPRRTSLLTSKLVNIYTFYTFSQKIMAQKRLFYGPEFLWPKRVVLWPKRVDLWPSDLWPEKVNLWPKNFMAQKSRFMAQSFYGPKESFYGPKKFLR
jgi:hypothetical protein